MTWDLTEGVGSGLCGCHLMCVTSQCVVFILRMVSAYPVLVQCMSSACPENVQYISSGHSSLVRNC